MSCCAILAFIGIQNILKNKIEVRTDKFTYLGYHVLCVGCRLRQVLSTHWLALNTELLLLLLRGEDHLLAFRLGHTSTGMLEDGFANECRLRLGCHPSAQLGTHWGLWLRVGQQDLVPTISISSDGSATSGKDLLLRHLSTDWIDRAAVVLGTASNGCDCIWVVGVRHLHNSLWLLTAQALLRLVLAMLSIRCIDTGLHEVNLTAKIINLNVIFLLLLGHLYLWLSALLLKLLYLLCVFFDCLFLNHQKFSQCQFIFP